MRLVVCHNGTVRVPFRILTIGLAGAIGLLAQNPPDWRKIGGSGVDLMLASPATGAVDRVWYSGDGSTLFARTLSGRVFQTNDFETWKPAANPPDPSPMVRAMAVRQPEPGATVVAVSESASRIWAMGHQLSR